MSARWGRGGAHPEDEGWSNYLGKDERIVWEGRPATGIRFRKADAHLIPFSLAWGGFAIFWEVMALSGGAPSFFALWGVPFVLVGLHMMVGRFPWDAYVRRKTRYALTNRRALIANSHWGRTMRSFAISPYTIITYRPGKLATIIFATETETDGEGGTTTTEHGFEFIRDGQVAYDIIRDVQAGKLSS